MRIGILGSGHVGRTLGAGFAAHGHEVGMATRSPEGEGAREFLDAAGRSGWVDSYAEVAGWCELAVFVPVWEGAANVVDLAGTERLAGKVLIDVTNAMGQDGSGNWMLTMPTDDSAGEAVQRMLPDARVVKAFNMVGVDLMISPNLPGGPPTMLIAGNDANAKELVGEILRDFGWDSQDLGGIEASRAIEGVTLAWMYTGMRRGKWDNAFKLLHG